MSGFSIADLHFGLVRSLRGRCLRLGDGLVAKNGDRHENCATCHTSCGPELLGYSGNISVAKDWTSGGIELRWPCPRCGVETTQETTALASIRDAEEVHRDPLCYRCRP